MKRDIGRLCSETQDVLVVGGGIHGATIVYHAARAGYRVAIVDKNDFCSATSANSLKILHGGLRYLQHGNIKRMRHSILSRREMMRLAPHLVEPLPCMLPLYGKGLRGRMAMRTALFINDCVGWDRNRGLPETVRLPEGHLVSRTKCLEVIPGIDRENLHGAAVWFDVLALDTERLALEYILEGVRYGAEAANYAETAAVEEADGLYAVTIKDRLNGQIWTIKAKYIVNAAGPWFEKSLFPLSGEKDSQPQQWALALNLVSRKRIFDRYAVALEGSDSYQDGDALIKRDKRLYFFVPWRGYTMIGTEYEVSRSGPDDPRVSRDTLQHMVDEVNAIYPPARLKYEDISFFHAGLLPMQGAVGRDGVQLEKNSTIVSPGNKRYGRILSLKGVKYTTAPHMAHEVVAQLENRMPPSFGGKVMEASSAEGQPPAGDSELLDVLKKRYGSRWRNVLQYVDKGWEKDPWIDTESRLATCEVRYLVAEEMACRLADIVFRRTGLGTAACPAPDTLDKAAACMGDVLGWDDMRQKEEVEEVLRRYHPLVAEQV